MNVVAPGRVEQGLGGEDQGTFSFLLAPVGEVYDFDIRFSGTWQLMSNTRSFAARNLILTAWCFMGL